MWGFQLFTPGCLVADERPDLARREREGLDDTPTSIFFFLFPS